MIYALGDTATHLYVVLSGIALLPINRNSIERIPGDLLGEEVLRGVDVMLYSYLHIWHVPSLHFTSLCVCCR